MFINRALVMIPVFFYYFSLQFVRFLFKISCFPVQQTDLLILFSCQILSFWHLQLFVPFWSDLPREILSIFLVSSSNSFLFKLFFKIYCNSPRLSPYFQPSPFTLSSLSLSHDQVFENLYFFYINLILCPIPFPKDYFKSIRMSQ